MKTGRIGEVFLDFASWEREQLWFKFMDQMMYMTKAFTIPKVEQDKARDYLINKYPEYTNFK